jgi:hypothetical protein
LGAVQDAGLVELWSMAVSPATRLITLSAPQLAGAEFGVAVSLDLPRMAVGAPGEDGGRGAVYYFGQVGGGWALLERLQPAELQPGDRFGSTVSAQGNRVVVGAPQRAQGSLVNAGAVYIYDQSLLGLQLGARFDGSAADARLGESISQDAVSVVAGAPGANEVRLWEGGVGTYSASATLTGTVPGAAFGSAVDLNNGLLAIGSPEDSSIVFRSGSVQLYARAAGAWSPVATLRAGGFQTLYGSAIALGDELVLGGAPGMFGGGFFSVGGGVVHEPRLQRLCSGSQVPCPCNSGSYGCVNSTGQGARLDGSGATSLVADGLTLQASGLPNGFCVHRQAIGGANRFIDRSVVVFSDGRHPGVDRSHSSSPWPKKEVRAFSKIIPALVCREPLFFEAFERTIEPSKHRVGGLSTCRVDRQLLNIVKKERVIPPT